MKYIKSILEKFDLMKILKYLIILSIDCMILYTIIIGVLSIWSKGNHEFLTRAIVELKFSYVPYLYGTIFFICFMILGFIRDKVIDVRGSTINRVKKWKLMLKQYYKYMMGIIENCNIENRMIKKQFILVIILFNILIFMLLIFIIVCLVKIYIKCVLLYLI